MQTNSFASRSFTPADQDWFASVSGDSNPMHMDALIARRTMAGFPVVHGIHTLLWSLDCLLRTLADGQTVASVKANFEKMIYLGDCVQAALLERDDKQAVAEVRIEQTTVMTIEVAFGPADSAAPPLPAGLAYRPEQPADLAFGDIEDMAGHIPIPHPTRPCSRHFPPWSPCSPPSGWRVCFVRHSWWGWSARACIPSTAI
jgi:acyl dehydratase